MALCSTCHLHSECSQSARNANLVDKIVRLSLRAYPLTASEKDRRPGAVLYAGISCGIVTLTFHLQQMPRLSEPVRTSENAGHAALHRYAPESFSVRKVLLAKSMCHKLTSLSDVHHSRTSQGIALHEDSRRGAHCYPRLPTNDAEVERKEHCTVSHVTLLQCLRESQASAQPRLSHGPLRTDVVLERRIPLERAKPEILLASQHIIGNKPQCAIDAIERQTRINHEKYAPRFHIIDVEKEKGIV